MAKTSDAVQILKQRLGDTPEIREMLAEEKLNVHVARMIYDARTEAGLTQKGLADLVGTRQQVIARLEDANYRGHSLSMLQRVAKALGRRLSIELLPDESGRAATS